MLHKVNEQHIDTIGSWLGVTTTTMLWVSDAETILVTLSAAVTIAFTLRKWYLFERRRHERK